MKIYYMKDEVTGNIYGIDRDSGGYPFVAHYGSQVYFNNNESALTDMMKSLQSMHLLPITCKIYSVIL